MKMSKRDARVAWKVAKAVAKVRAGSGNAGGCHRFHVMLDFTMPELFRELDAAFRSWPYYSGNTAWPVPDPDGRLHPMGAYNTLPRWYGNYGLLRRSLWRHVALHFKKLYEETPE